jgi:putative Holliday junction resolvase
VRFLGVDPGGRRMGLALGEDGTGVVTPLEVVDYGGAVAAAAVILDRARRHAADQVVIGLPVDVEGRETPACARSRKIGREVEVRGMAIAYQGEYLSTREARERARDAGLKAGQPVDHLAAQVMLEEYLSDR